MVRVDYIGTLGNKLWQYCVGRILAEKYGLKLQTKAIDGFENTKQEVNGNVGTNYVEAIETYNPTRKSVFYCSDKCVT